MLVTKREIQFDHSRRQKKARGGGEREREGGRDGGGFARSQ